MSFEDIAIYTNDEKTRYYFISLYMYIKCFLQLLRSFFGLKVKEGHHQVCESLYTTGLVLMGVLAALRGTVGTHVNL